MKQLTILPLFVLALLTGCQTSQTYKTLYVLDLAVGTALDIFAEQVVLEQVSPETQARVEAAEKRYKDAALTALALSTIDWESPPPDAVSKAAAELLILLEKYTK